MAWQATNLQVLSHLCKLDNNQMGQEIRMGVAPWRQRLPSSMLFLDPSEKERPLWLVCPWRMSH